MDLIFAVLVAFFGLAAAVLSRLLADDFKAWNPRIVKWLLRRAVRKLPHNLKERYEEEWGSDLNDTPGELTKLVAAAGLSLAANGIIYNERFTFPGRILKGILDKSVACALTIAVLPLMGLSALLIKLDSSGPVFRRIRCRGLGGRKIILFKFRTVHAREAEGDDGFGGSPSKRTMVGALLYKLRIDELPQLINVLRGDVSLVGPLPKPSQNSDNEEPLRVKPGITGWSQINGLELSAEEKAAYDRYYVEHWSIWLDLTILIQTVRAVLLASDDKQ